MVELSLMASAGFSLAILHQDHGRCRAPKDLQALLPGHGKRQEILRSGCLQLDAPHFELPCQTMNLLSEFDQQGRQDLTYKKPALIDVQDVHPDSVLFSFGIAEQCVRREKILQFLMSGSNIVEGEALNLSLLSDLMGLHTLAIDMRPQHYAHVDDEFCLYEVNGSGPSICPERELRYPKPILDIIGDISCSTMIAACTDGRLFFTSTRAEMKNLLSVVSKFYLPNISTDSTKKTMLVPYFTRFGGKNKQKTQLSSSKLQMQTVSPPNSPETIKLKPQPKRRKNNACRERDFYSKNYFHACEMLMSFISNQKGGKLEMLSLKKSGHEISELLTHLSAGIAGTGLAVLFSVMYNIVSGRVPFCTAKLWNTAVGCVLVWISLAVNGLRDTLIHISKNSGKLKLKEEEIILKVQRSVNEIFFRAVTLVVVALFRFA